MLKFSTRLTNTDQNIIIGISNNGNLNGLSDGMNDFIEKETSLSINPADDYEVERYNQNSTYVFYFNFYDTTYDTTLSKAGFVTADTISDIYLKSYYIFMVYDSINSESQKLLHTGYYNGFIFSGLTTIYSINPSMEIANLYLKNFDLESVSDNTIYLRLSFFNAKSGKQQLFYNDANSGDLTENIFYFPITINRTTLTYSLSSPINAKEFINYTYVNKVNENSNILPEEKVEYPTGTALNGNTYFNI